MTQREGILILYITLIELYTICLHQSPSSVYFGIKLRTAYINKSSLQHRHYYTIYGDIVYT